MTEIELNYTYKQTIKHHSNSSLVSKALKTSTISGGMANKFGVFEVHPALLSFLNCNFLACFRHYMTMPCAICCQRRAQNHGRATSFVCAIHSVFSVAVEKRKPRTIRLCHLHDAWIPAGRNPCALLRTYSVKVMTHGIS